ncbi:MAG: hypothetical protein AABX89_07865 [Candidatus Thermoplasmatota archaeon]
MAKEGQADGPVAHAGALLPGRRISVSALATAAVGALLALGWMLNIRRSEPFLKDAAGALSILVWDLIMLALLAALLLLQLFLLRRRSLPAAVAGQVLSLGCTGCGTVFERADDGSGAFSCPNCGRAGGYGSEVAGATRSVLCVQCQFEFKAYRSPAACPQCRTLQPIS